MNTKLPFYAVVDTEFAAVNQLILNSLSSNVPLVEEISAYLIDAGGKRLRPLLVLLAAKACHYQEQDHIKLAAIIEFLHTAMLLHDDVVDESLLRRGRKTVNAEWGNPASVLVGDFLHSRAFEMMVEIGNMKVMQILSFSTNTIAEGEVQQLSNICNPDVTEASYMEIINRKTAALFEASSHSGAVLAGASDTQQTVFKKYGQHLGMAFQLIDDILDYEGSTASLGKNIGDDLAEGKVTLPLIAAMRNGTEAETTKIRTAILSGGSHNLEEIISIVQKTGGLDYTQNQAEKEIQQALNCLSEIEDSPYKSAMQNLARFSISRNT